MPTQVSDQVRLIQNEKAPPLLLFARGLKGDNLALTSIESLELTGSEFCPFRIHRRQILGTHDVPGWHPPARRRGPREVSPLRCPVGARPTPESPVSY